MLTGSMQTHALSQLRSNGSRPIDDGRSRNSKPHDNGLEERCSGYVRGHGTWGPQTYVVATELPALRLRDMTLQLGFFVNVISKYVVFSPVILSSGIYLLFQRLIWIIQLCRQLHHPLPCRCGICGPKLQGWINIRRHCGYRVCLHFPFRTRVPRQDS